MQGGVIQLPIPDFPTGVMRGRFLPGNGALYACGLYGWAGNRQSDGGFYRVRATGKPFNLPLELHAVHDGLILRFTDELDKTESENPSNYAVKIWGLKRTAEYGSKHYNEHPLEISRAQLAPDGKTIHLSIPQIQPTWCMEIRYQLRTRSGEPITQTIHNTIHELQSPH
jgi:hypothetical protein